MWRPLAHRRFRFLWFGQCLRSLGDGALTVILATVVLSNGSPTELGIILAGRAAAMVFAVVLGGALADRGSRVHMMVCADVVRLSAVVVIAISGLSSVALVTACTFVIGIAEAFFRPAYNGVVPQLVPSGDLRSANALLIIARQTMMLLGPAVGGLMVLIVGGPNALLVDAGCFALAATTLVFVGTSDRRRPSDRERASLVAEAFGGFRLLRAHLWIVVVIVVSSLHLLVAVGPWLVLFPELAIMDLGGPGTYSLALTVFGAGSLAGAVIASRLPEQRTAVMIMATLVPYAVMLLIAAYGAPLSIMIIAIAVGGAGLQLHSVLWVTSIQRKIPEELLSRVFAIDYLGSLVLLPVGLAISGPIAEVVGSETVLKFGGWVALIACAVALTLPAIRSPSLDPGVDQLSGGTVV